MNKKNVEILKKRMQEVIAVSGLSNTEIADKTGINKQTIGDLKDGAIAPRIDTVIIYGVKPTGLPVG